MELKYTFNEVAKEYDKFRPAYPKKLFSDIIDYSNVETNGEILEIGCGTGQSTQGFVDLGYKHITCIELGKNLAELTAEKYKSEKAINIYNIDFEEWESGYKNYDLAISGTAFHFINPNVGYPKVYNLLKQGGTIGFFWTVHVQVYNDLYNEIRELYRKYAPELDDSIKPTPVEVIEGIKSKIQKTELFRDVQVREYSWKHEYSSKEYISLLNTHSKHRLLNEDVRLKLFNGIEGIINNNGGIIEKPQLVALFLGRK